MGVAQPDIRFDFPGEFTFILYMCYSLKFLIYTRHYFFFSQKYVELSTWFIRHDVVNKLENREIVLGKIFIKFFNLHFYFYIGSTTFGFSSFCHYWNLTSLIVVLLRLRVYVKFSLHCIWHAIDIHSRFRLFSLHFWFFSIKYTY